MKQYRTLGEGDRRLPGYECRLRYVPHAQWVPSDAVGIIDADDIRRSEYRVPCSATVAPDGYEVVQRERLPKGAIVRRETWAVWSSRKDAWVPAESGYPYLNLADGIVYAAPADELAALYAHGDAEREQPAPAPVSPCPCCAERDRLAAEVGFLRGECHEAIRTAREYCKEAAGLRERIDAARAALEGRDG